MDHVVGKEGLFEPRQSDCRLSLKVWILVVVLMADLAPVVVESPVDMAEVGYILELDFRFHLRGLKLD